MSKDTWRKSGRRRPAPKRARIYSLLVRPIPGLESKSRLIIVPDGRLHLLPFSSLPDSQGRYLLESHIVTYAPSATEEGIANLVRAFLCAGAKSVVASLQSGTFGPADWAASDVYTLNLMQHFYRYIADGEDKGSALRHAQVDLIKQFANEAMPF